MPLAFTEKFNYKHLPAGSLINSWKWHLTTTKNPLSIVVIKLQPLFVNAACLDFLGNGIIHLLENSLWCIAHSLCNDNNIWCLLFFLQNSFINTSYLLVHRYILGNGINTWPLQKNPLLFVVIILQTLRVSILHAWKFWEMASSICWKIHFGVLHIHYAMTKIFGACVLLSLLCESTVCLVILGNDTITLLKIHFGV